MDPKETRCSWARGYDCCATTGACDPNSDHPILNTACREFVEEVFGEEYTDIASNIPSLHHILNNGWNSNVDAEYNSLSCQVNIGKRNSYGDIPVTVFIIMTKMWIIPSGSGSQRCSFLGTDNYLFSIYIILNRGIEHNIFEKFMLIFNVKRCCENVGSNHSSTHKI